MAVGSPFSKKNRVRRPTGPDFPKFSGPDGRRAGISRFFPTPTVVGVGFASEIPVAASKMLKRRFSKRPDGGRSRFSRATAARAAAGRDFRVHQRSVHRGSRFSRATAVRSTAGRDFPVHQRSGPPRVAILPCNCGRIHRGSRFSCATAVGSLRIRTRR